MPESVRLEVEGLREFSKALKAVDEGLPGKLRERFLALAVTVIGRAERRGAPPRALRPRAGAKAAGIAMPRGGTNSSKPAYYPWLDFGGSVGRGHVQGVPWSGAIKRRQPKGGAYLYPAIAESGDEIKVEVFSAVDDLASRAGLETR